VERRIRRVAVFCGSSPGADPELSRRSYDVGRGLAERGIGVVYGAGGSGLMREVSQGALDAAGEVIGVIPRSMVEREWGREDLTEVHVVETMHERKAMMADRADGFIMLPGGYGTLDEFFEVLTWTQLGIHVKPCAILDVNGYFAPLTGLLANAAGHGFLRDDHRHMVLTGTDPGELIDAMTAWAPPATEKWLDPSER
jgi:uncharacterized protein (TIGR00730 family)